MITAKEYNDLWKNGFNDIVKENKLPDYSRFRERENMLEDYLDIFRGLNTRNDREGSDAIIYPHPFFNEGISEQKQKQKKIKYILVGESAPQMKPPRYANGNCKIKGRDKANTYFYNATHLGNTNYLSSVRIAFNCPDYKPCPENKIQTLQCLAENGVLVLDLFPFAYNYSTSERDKLNNKNITKTYWDDISNPASLINRLKHISPLLDPDWDLCLIAPCKISSYIINPKNGFKALKITPSGLHPQTFRDVLPYQKRCNGYNWKKLATTKWSPGSKLIQIAF